MSMDYNNLFDYDYFKVNASEYVKSKDFFVTKPASLSNPKDHAVMFIQEKYLSKANEIFSKVANCIIFWPTKANIPPDLLERHAVVPCDDPHLDYCFFFKKHNISNLANLASSNMINNRQSVEEDVTTDKNYVLCGNVTIGTETQIFPFVYVNGNVHIGDHCYIGAGVKIIGNVYIGNNVLIKENSVLGADGLSTDRNENGEAVTMPQFGGLIIEDNVQIGANTTIARGTIDNTVIRRGCKIDNCCWVSHNNFFDENVFMVGESTTFGSVTVGKNTLISGNATIRNGITIGSDVLIGAGAVVTRTVKDHAIVSGNPAKELLFPRK